MCSSDLAPRLGDPRPPGCTHAARRREHTPPQTAYTGAPTPTSRKGERQVTVHEVTGTTNRQNGSHLPAAPPPPPVRAPLGKRRTRFTRRRWKEPEHPPETQRDATQRNAAPTAAGDAAARCSARARPGDRRAPPRWRPTGTPALGARRTWAARGGRGQQHGASTHAPSARGVVSGPPLFRCVAARDVQSDDDFVSHWKMTFRDDLAQSSVLLYITKSPGTRQCQ